MKKEVKFVFDNEQAAEHFVTWLCEAGEQDYWNWMEYREQEEDGDITATKIDYWNGGEKFGAGDIIMKCSRLDKK